MVAGLLRDGKRKENDNVVILVRGDAYPSAPCLVGDRGDFLWEDSVDFLWKKFPPQIAERMCAAIDGQDKATHFLRLLLEYNEWLINQQRQQVAIVAFLRGYLRDDSRSQAQGLVVSHKVKECYNSLEISL